MKFTVQAKVAGSRARAGIIETPHGTILTPAFIPVATKATIKSLTPEMVRDDVGAQAILANTYHLYLQPGTEVLEKAGGLSKFMNWSRPTFTDSGGFQAFSLGGNGKNRKSKVEASSQEPGQALLRRFVPLGASSKLQAPESFPEGGSENIPMAVVSEEGVAFKSVIDGSSHMFTPERSIEIQHAIGADIIFAFDECLLPQEPYERQREAVERTTRWAERCLARHCMSASAGAVFSHPAELASRNHSDLQSLGRSRIASSDQAISARSNSPRTLEYSLAPALFGIIQGGRHEDLRRLSARQISAMNFDGFGIGGSFDKEDIGTAVGWVSDELPEGKPRHLLGIGSEPADLILGIENGMDTFDCVAPTRIARTGTAYVSSGGATSRRANESRSKLNLTNAEFINDFSPLDHSCHCYTCTNYTRAYLSHLFRAKEMLAATLVSVHNLYFVVDLVKRAREAILDGSFSELKKRFLAID